MAPETASRPLRGPSAAHRGTQKGPNLPFDSHPFHILVTWPRNDHPACHSAGLSVDASTLASPLHR
eukprot:3944720-Pyramimonas_sp.AAC.1